VDEGSSAGGVDVPTWADPGEVATLTVPTARFNSLVPELPLPGGDAALAWYQDSGGHATDERTSGTAFDR
jgi:hypothetical protein